MANIACEKEKLEMLEQRHRDTAEQLEACMDRDETELLRQRSNDEQDAVDNQKFLVDNLEFQQLEVIENIPSHSISHCCCEAVQFELHSRLITAEYHVIRLLDRGQELTISVYYDARNAH